VAEWLETKYPEIEARAAKEGGEIHWGDETGVRSTCQHSRGYARPGATPELTVPGTRFSVNMISTITNQGKVRWMIDTGKMNAALFIVFLTRLIAGATKKVFLIVDHLSVHEAAAVERVAGGQGGSNRSLLLAEVTRRNGIPDEYLNCDVKGETSIRMVCRRIARSCKASCTGSCRDWRNLPARIASYFKHKYIAYAAVQNRT